MTTTWNAAGWAVAAQRACQKAESDLHPDHCTIERDGSRARLLDASNGQILKTFEYPDRIPVGTLFSPDGKTLLIWFTPYEVGRSGISIPVSRGETVAQLWNILPGEEPTLRAAIQPGKWYRNLEDYFDFQAAWFTPDSRRLVTASGDGQIQLWTQLPGSSFTRCPAAIHSSHQMAISRGATGKRSGARLGYHPRTGPVNTWTIYGFSDSPFSCSLPTTVKN
jgi:WD40 repeat protein